MIASYSVLGTPIAYVGEVVNNDQTNGILTFTMAMMVVLEGGRPKDWVKIPMAQKSSRVSVDVKAIPGILVEDPDEEFLAQYNNNLVRVYSKLTLA